MARHVRGRPSWRDGAKSVRFRTAAAATLVVGFTLALAGVALFALARAELQAAVRTAAETRARDIAALAAAAALPVPLPGRGGAIVARVVDEAGVVLTASADLPGGAASPPFDVRAMPGEMLASVVRWRYDAGPLAPGDVVEPEPAWRIALGVATARGPVTVQVIASLEPVEDALDVLAPLLAAILPLVLIVTAAAVWVMAGRTLRPVEAIRSRAAAITATDADARVPVPTSRDEVHDLAVTINRMLDRLHAAAADQRRFVADASHELRSPVAAIRTMLEVAERYPAAVAPAELLADMRREAARLARLTDDLLTLARHDERARADHRGSNDRVDLTDVLREEVAAVQALRQVNVHLDDAALPTVRGDGEQLRRIVRNVLDNAVRHAASGVWIEAHIVEWDADERDADERDAGERDAWAANVLIRISDDGAGIAPADREKVFERFVRLDDGRGRADGGTGLGLAVCRALVHAHGGTIGAVDGGHGGATFEIRLPTTAADR